MAIVFKDLRLLVRDRVALLFLLLAPVVVISVAGLSLSSFYGGWKASDVRYLLPVVDRDGSRISRKLVSSLREASDVQLVDAGEEEARRLVSKSRRASAALLIPEGFGEDLRRGKPVNLTLWTDPVQHLEVLKIRSEVERAWAGLVAVQVAGRIAVVEVLTYAGDADFEAVADDASELAGRLLGKSFGLEEVSLTSTRTHFNTFDQNVPGFAITFLMLGMLLGVGLGLVDEREWGMLYRLSAAPVRVSRLVAGKVISRFAMGTLQMVILFVFGRLVFAVSWGKSLPALGLVILAVSFAAASFGLVIGAVSPSRDSVLPLGTIAIMGMVAIGGCWWPMSIEPRWLQNIAHVFPPAWAMRAFNDLMLRERGLGDVWPAVVMLVAFGVVYLIVGIRIYLRHEEHTR